MSKARKQQQAVGNAVGQINADTGKVNEAVKPQPQTPAAAEAKAVQPSKAQQSLAKLREAWEARKIDLSKLQVVNDGKFMNVIVADGWPDIVIGPSGGITLPQVRSYARAFDAAAQGDIVFKKQQEMDAKKTLAAAPKATWRKPEPKNEEPAKQSQSTTTKKKGQAHDQIEKKLSQQLEA
jgi:hypothetical protein